LLTTLALVGALLTTPQADKWDIKTAVAPKASATWDVSADVVAPDGDHHAAFKLVIEVKDTEKDKPLQSTYSWKELVLDSGQGMPDNSWDVKIDAQGGITGTEATEGGDALRKMLIPMTFLYPDKAVGVGDAWTNTLKSESEKDDHSITVDFKVEAAEKLGDVDVLKITEKFTEKGPDGMTGTGTWWVDKAGKPQKFEVKANRWVVPMAGTDSMDATLKGTLAK
jgi:hypothetical protein